MVSLLLTLNRFHTMFWCFHCLLWTYRCRQGAVREMNCWRFFLWAFSERQKVFSAENSTFVRLCCFLRVINSNSFFHLAFHSESRLYTCLTVKELLAQKRHDIWSLSDSNGIRTHNHLVRKRTLNHLAKLAKFVYKLSGLGFESRCCHLDFRMVCINNLALIN